ncbi:MAG: AAA family ATPase [Thermodesulfobacteriaceae bacterium]|nr:AAA family ATPase [Thermodesulfobacteriaceae bacterium]MCX8041654.1 AAA family ATPase [Thermodesulfobacteriaceae bacterium]MDW8135306.1 AAA family ATPase [Thermodesulfobacterium sp.]
MAVWIRNLISNLEKKPVLILHGNVRDKYIDEYKRVYDNLTSLLREVARQLPINFYEILFYDAVSKERRETWTSNFKIPSPDPNPDSELMETEPKIEKSPSEKERGLLRQIEPPSRVFSKWKRELSSSDQSKFVVVFYLDKLVTYKQTGYTDEEKQVLLWMEKVIENITPNHRLILVALQDTMVPVELYLNSPKTCILSIPMPNKSDRIAYLKHCLGDSYEHLELIADLTDGLFLRDLDNIANEIKSYPKLSTREVRRLVNKYRLGEQEDYWSQLSIEKLNNALRWFVEEEGVKGQEEAISKVIDVLCLARAGLSGVASNTTSKPKGVLFFAGLTGVGKTLVAKKLAKFLFGTEEAFLRFDMSEFKEEHTVSKFIGSPPGYVGYEKGGMLTNAVREKPFSVILFDEIEKAHPKIMDIFLQILDDGRLTDSRGQTVFFTETVIIFTSNIGTRTTDSRGAPIDERERLEKIINSNLKDEEKKQKIREHFIRAVEQFFIFEISRPELLNRIGNNIVPFNYIHTPEVQIQIVETHLKRIKEEFEDKYRTACYKVNFEESVAKWLVEKYGEQITMYGGRGITNAIESEIMIPLAKAVLRAEHNNERNLRFVVTVFNQGIKVVLK